MAMRPYARAGAHPRVTGASPSVHTNMKFDPQKHRRRSIRLHGYDYSSPAAYFITICTDNRQVLFGEVVGGQMRRNSYGEIVQEEWFRSATIRKEISLDAWIVMPNHVHGIVTIIGAHGHAPVARGLEKAEQKVPWLTR
jgi:REP-associated tyrosine transposase